MKLFSVTNLIRTVVFIVVAASGSTKAGLLVNNNGFVTGADGLIFNGISYSAIFDYGPCENILVLACVEDQPHTFEPYTPFDDELFTLLKVQTDEWFRTLVNGEHSNFIVGFSNTYTQLVLARQTIIPGHVSTLMMQYETDYFAGKYRAMADGRIQDYFASPTSRHTFVKFRANGKVSVPEPSTLAIFALGMMGLVTRRIKKQ